MKKLLLIFMLAGGLWQWQQHGFKLGFGSGPGAFDKEGKPLTVLFVGPGCGDRCEQAGKLIASRHIQYEEIDVSDSIAASKYHIRQYPSLLIGKQHVIGDERYEIIGALAENYGRDVLTRSERIAMDGHFDEQGRPRVVLYGTSWCPYCKQERELFASRHVDYDNINVEASDLGRQSYTILQGNGYPLTYVGYRRFSGYQEKEILAAIDELTKKR